jgi:hypothetical protein
LRTCAEGPTLKLQGTYPKATRDLPWSRKSTYPGPTLELPWTYPGAMLPPTTGPTSSRVAGPRDLAAPRLPSLPPSPPARPKAQDLPQTPAPGLPCTSRRTLARPLHGLAGRLGALGSQSWARGPIPVFRKIRLRGKSTKSTHEKQPTLEPRGTYPTPATLEPERRRQRPGRLDLPYTSPTTAKNQPTNQPTGLPPT